VRACVRACVRALRERQAGQGRAGARLSGAGSGPGEVSLGYCVPTTPRGAGMAALDAATGKPSSVPSNGCAPAFRAPARPAAAACQRVEKDIRVV